VRNLLFLIVPICFLYHLFTLGRLPLPTHEEVEMVSTAHYLSEKGIEHLFSSDFDPSYRLSFAKAPLPILANAALLEKYPLNPFNMRIINTVFGFFVVFLMFSYFSKLEKGSFKNASFFMALAFLFDPLLNSKIHTSTTEWIALYFFLLSLKKEFDKEGHTFSSTLYSAFFMALALSSSYPLLLFLPFLLLHKIISAFQDTSENQSRSFYHLALWPFFLAAFYLPWFFSFFSFHSFWISLAKAPGLALLPSSEYFLCISTGILLLYSLTQGYSFEYPTILRLCLGVLVTFHAASYFLTLSPALVIPFYYLLAFNLLPLNKTSSNARQIRYYPMALVLGINMLLFFLQFIYLIVSFNARNETGIQSFVKERISPLRHVSGDALFYYAATSHQDDFRLIPNATKLKTCISAHDYDYLILSPKSIEALDDKSLFVLHEENLVQLGTIRYPEIPMSSFMAAIGLLDEKEIDSYSGVLYTYKR
jgi:hypothetical protein